jgi:uroporphyrinogen decarboxylase
MIAGRGTPDQAPAHKLRQEDPETFGALIDLLTEATIEYLDQQVQAGAEVVKIFDSWAGIAEGRGVRPLRAGTGQTDHGRAQAPPPRPARHRLPREAGENYVGFAKAVGADGLAIDTKVDPAWAAEHLQPDGCVQGNLDPKHMITGGEAW